MNITVRITKNYGQRAVYPVCDIAQKLAALVGHKTFTDRDLDGIKDLGYTISVAAETL
jgi:hypothetical protein